MNFLKKFLRNIAITILVIVGMAIFAKIFYPETIPFFLGIGQTYNTLKLWPIIILIMLLSALPEKSK